MSVESANLLCRLCLVINAVFIGAYLNKIMATMECIRRNLDSINNEANKARSDLERIESNLDNLESIAYQLERIATVEEMEK